MATRTLGPVALLPNLTTGAFDQIDEIREWFRNYKSDGKFADGKWSGITEGQNGTLLNRLVTNFRTRAF